jgi:transcriptional regulator
MYLPISFVEPDRATLIELIQRRPLGTLVTLDNDGLHADHIPFLHESNGDSNGRLIGHVARNSDAWRRSGSIAEVLVVFQGVSAYISPNWYPSKREAHRVVPTYNYAVVHVYGPLVVRDDPKWIRGVVGKLTKRMENVQLKPWKMADAPADYLDEQITQIVGIEIPISRMIGKWKVSQNRVEADRLGAIDGLRASGDDEQMAMADLIASKLPNQ